MSEKKQSSRKPVIIKHTIVRPKPTRKPVKPSPPPSKPKTK